MTFLINYAGLFFLFNREGKNVLKHSVLIACGQKFMRNNKNNATLKMVQPGFSPGLGENGVKLLLTLIFDISNANIYKMDRKKMMQKGEECYT